MGAGASIQNELGKPIDASDIRESGSLELASCEIKRLRSELGHLAKLAGIDIVMYDCSDILLGDHEDFNRCVREIAHIRSCLRLHTASSRRKTRVYGNDEINTLSNLSTESKDAMNHYSPDSDSDSN